MVESKRQRAIWAVVALSALLVSLDAEARVGGGQGFGGGGGSSGGGSGGGDGLGLLLELLFRFLWWLCWHHPMVGIPLTAVVLFILYRHFLRDRTDVRKNNTNAAGMMRRKQSASALKLVDLDPKFSETLFLDHVQLVYTELRQGLPVGKTDVLTAHVDDRVLAKQRALPQPNKIRGVIFGSVRVDRIQLGQKWQMIDVSLLTNFEQVGRNGVIDKRLRVERWTFRRRSGLSSFGPEQLRSLGCPSCGSNLPVIATGKCPSCDVVRTDGRLHWIVSGITIVSDSTLNPIDLTLGGGVEPGVGVSTKIDHGLGQGLRAMRARYSDWTADRFRDRVTHVFTALQAAWSTQKWETARPYQSDAMFRVNQFWIRQYQQDKLWNKNDALDIERIEFTKVVSDSWLESITVRITASMLDWTENEAGKVVSGSKTEIRTFSEYWTFIRSVGAESKSTSFNDCPSCGAPLDNVNMSGICGYCDSHITTGHFDWVLSRIEQAEAYGG